MNIEKFTERSRGFIQAAQTIAMREDHQRMMPEHLLKALLDDDQGLASNLIKRAGGEPQRVVEAVEVALGKFAKVTRGRRRGKMARSCGIGIHCHWQPPRRSVCQNI